MIRIKITNPTEADARAAIAALVEIHGTGIVPASYVRVGDVERATGTAAPQIAAGISALHAATPAPDGYPTEETDETPELVAQTAEAVERDADGIPWDERIHTSNKSTKQDGTWKRKPGVDDAVFTSVLAELKAANTARTIEAATPLTAPEADASAANAFGATPPPPPPAAEAPPPPPAAAEAPPPPPSPAAAEAPPPPPSPAAAEAPPFVQIMQKVHAAQQAGKFDKAAFDSALATCGLENIGKLMNADDGVRAAFDALVPA